MSSFALKGFIAGAANALSAKIDSEQDRTNKILANRVNLAYENSQKYANTVNALKKEAINNDKLFMSYQDPENPWTDAERIVAMQMPTLIPNYLALKEKGRDISIRDMIKVGPGAANMTVDGYLKQIGSLQQQEARTVPPIVTEGTGLFSPSAERQMERLRQMSGAFGMTPEDVARFQTVPEAGIQPQYGSFSKKFVDSLAERSPAQQLVKLAERHIEVSKQYGPDSPQAQALIEEGNLIKNSRDIFGEEATTQLGYLNQLTLALTNLQTTGGDPAKIKDLERKIKVASDNYLKYINPPAEKKDPAETLSKLDSWYTKTVRNNYLNKFGNRPLTNSDWTYNPVTGIPVYSGKHSETGQYAKIEEMNIRIRALNMIVAPLLKDGKATDEAVSRFLQSNNLFTKDEQGRWILPQEITIPQYILDAVKAEDQRKSGGSIPSNRREPATPPDPSRIAGTMTKPTTQAASEATSIISKEQFEKYRTRNNLTRDQAIEALKKEGHILAGDE